MKKVGKALLAVAGALIVCAIVLGVLNGLVAKGEWTFGWLDYRYDDTSYHSGSGSVIAPNADNLQKIDLDWIDGRVEIVACQDMCISLSESAESGVSEENELRWSLSEDGSVLTVKYRKSSWFFQGTHKENKTLILRIPQRFFEQLRELNVTVRSSEVTVTDVQVSALRFTSESGSLTGKGCNVDNLFATSKQGDIRFSTSACPSTVDVTTQSGEVTLALPAESSFALQWSSKGGELVSDLPLTQTDGRYVCGTGAADFRVNSGKGDLLVEKAEE